MKDEKWAESHLEKVRAELVRTAQAVPEDLTQESAEEIMAHGKELGYWEGYEAALRAVLDEDQEEEEKGSD